MKTRYKVLLAGLTLGTVLLGLRLHSPAVEKRCGWLENPSPANWWLIDRDGSWTVGMQGGYQAPGIDNISDLTRGEFVNTNRSYGYACVCMDVTADPNAMRITNIYSMEQLPLATCREDPALPAAP